MGQAANEAEQRFKFTVTAWLFVFVGRLWCARFALMPSKDRPAPEQTLQQIVSEVGSYPIEAFHFVQSGLAWTQIKIHGPDLAEGGEGEGAGNEAGKSEGGAAKPGKSSGKSSGESSGEPSGESSGAAKSAGAQPAGPPARPTAAGQRRARRELPEQSPRHVSGQQLCEGLRMYAIEQWGMMAGTVLRRWNLRGTVDFGRIVFALVDGGLMHKTERDKLDDFRDVYDFDRAFDSGAYNIGSRP
jgi:uncharacterized repeat protein (TIGR04138 family)